MYLYWLNPKVKGRWHLNRSGRKWLEITWLNLDFSPTWCIKFVKTMADFFQILSKYENVSRKYLFVDIKSAISIFKLRGADI